MGELIPKHGGYRKLRSFQAAQQVYDLTVEFCDRFVDKRSRTHDQMVQAARSGVQNIAEGSMASATSKKTELKLTGVARASLEELLLDCEDFLRQRGLRLWHKDDPRALAVRNRFRSDASDRSDQSDRQSRWLSDSGRRWRKASERGEKLKLSEEELAFYDALETNDSAVAVLGDEVLRAIAREVADSIRKNVTIDWTMKESVKAKLRVLVKRVLLKYDYPPDKQPQAVATVLQQAELIAPRWAA